MSKLGLKRDELEDHGKDSLINYIGTLQTELQALYDKQFPVEESVVTEELDFFKG